MTYDEKLVKEIPRVIATPMGDDDGDRNAARAATHLLNHAFDQNERNLISDLYMLLNTVFLFLFIFYKFSFFSTN